MSYPEAVIVDSVAIFQNQRRRLFLLAYNMLGSRMDAEDVLQDAFLRWQGVDLESIRVPEAWLTTAVTRLALDRLRSAAHRREVYPGTWLPEPLLDEPSAEQREVLRSQLSLAFLCLLERLSPEERGVFLLREASGLSYREIAGISDKSEPACRQLMSRARTTLHNRPMSPSKTDKQALRQLVPKYLQAVREGDEQALLGLLSQDAVLTSDGGGKAKAAINPLNGVDRIVKFLLGLNRKVGIGQAMSLAVVNSETGIVLRENGATVGICGFRCANDRIAEIYWVDNPDKLPQRTK